MKLTSLTADLEKFRPNQPPVLEETLHAMISLCLDIQAYCSQGIDDGVVKDHRELNNHLAALSSLLCDIYDANSAEIKKHTMDAFPDQLRVVRQETRAVKQRLLSQEGQLDDLGQTKSELEKLLAQEQQNLAAIQSEESLVRKVRDALDQTVAKLRSISLPALEQEKAGLESEKLALEQKIDTLKAHIARLTDTLADCRQKLSTSEGECSALDRELTARNQELARSDARRRELDQQLSGVNEKISAAENLCRDLQSQHQAAVENLNRLQQDIEAGRIKLINIKAEIASRTDIYNGLLPELESSTEALRVLTEKTDAAQRTLESNVGAIAEGNARLAAQEEQFLRQQQTLTELQNAIAGRDADIADLGRRIAEAEATLAGRTDSCDAKQQQLQLLNNDIQIIEADFRDLTIACDEAAEKRHDLLEQQEAAGKQLCDLNEELEQHRSSLEAARTQSAGLTDAIAKTQAELEDCRKHIDEQNQQKATLDRTLGERRDEMLRLSKVLEDARAEEAQLNGAILDNRAALERLANVEQEKEAAQKTLTETRQKLGEAETQRDTLREEAAHTESLTQGFVQEIEILNEQLETINADWLEKKNTRDNIQATSRNTLYEAAMLEKEAERLTEELEKINGDIAAANDKIARLQQSITDAKGTHDGLFDQVYTLQQELDYQNAQIADFQANELKNAREALEAAVQLMSELNAERDQLAAQKDEILAERTRVDSEIKRVRMELLSNDSPLKNSVRELDALLAKQREENDRLEQAQSEKQTQLDELNARISMLSDKLAKILDDIKVAQTFIDNPDNVALEAEHIRIRKEKEQRRDEIKKMGDELPSLSNELSRIRTEHGDLLAQKNYAEAEIRRLSEECRRLSEDLSKLKDRQTQDKVDQYRRSIDLLSEIQTRLIDAASALDLSTDAPIGTLLDWQLDSIGGKLDYYRSCIRDYTDILQQTICLNN